jgi:hypothetical protein
MTTIPLPALLALPLTLTVGPLVAYNALMLLAVVLASAAAYLLCWELTHRFSASLLGGLLFGLSPYMLGHTLSQHLDLTFVFPVPLLVLLALRYLRGRTSTFRFVLGFAGLLLLQLGASFELFLDVTLMIVLAVLLSLLGRDRRRQFVRLGIGIGASYALCLPVLVPIAVLALRTSHAPLRYEPRNYAIDLVNLFVPTSTVIAGSLRLSGGFSQHFVGNIGEQDGYLGVPLLVIAVLALRADWRRGAWLAGALFAAALGLSFGPELTANGGPLFSLPFGPARLPLLQNLLPARMSLFSVLIAACLCAVWFARARPASLQVAVAAVLVLSLLPNFWPSPRLLRAWSVSDAFGWSTAHVSQGFVRGETWRRAVPPGSTVLVLPAADRTAATYWQVKSGMRFSLAVPATPYVPPARAAAPMVRGLTNDQPPSLAAARLRAFLISDRIQAVSVAAAGRRRWGRIVAAATETAPLRIGSNELYRVPRALAPEVTNGRPVEATVIFTEWIRGQQRLRIATRSRGTWQVSTLDETTEPIWSPRVIVTPTGTTLATWIDETDPTRAIRAAVLPRNGSWTRTVTLENGDGLGSVALGAGDGDLVVLAWHDGVDTESRVRADIYANRRWTPIATLAQSLALLEYVKVAGLEATSVRWRLVSIARSPVGRFEARREGNRWAVKRRWR